MNTQRSLLDYDAPMTYERMMSYLDLMSERYPLMGITCLGESILGKSIPIVTLGEGEKTVLYVGSHHGMEWITTIFLLRFINEFCELYQSEGKVYQHSLRYLFSTRSICIIPMLNPDGVEYQIQGVKKDHILYDRLLAMNGGSDDFSFWQANARGVDLNHNYACGFAEYKALEAEMGILGGAKSRYSGEMPESEPEVGSLCNYLRYRQNIRAVLTLHTQGEEIYFSSGDRTAPRSHAIAGALSRMSGYRLAKPEGAAAYGGLTDWCIRERNIPSFTVECGKGKNPLPIHDWFRIYSAIREMLFLMPTMI